MSEGVGNGVGVAPVTAGTGVARNASELVPDVVPFTEFAYTYQCVGNGFGATAKTTPCRFAAASDPFCGKTICTLSLAGGVQAIVGGGNGVGVLQPVAGW